MTVTAKFAAFALVTSAVLIAGMLLVAPFSAPANASVSVAEKGDLGVSAHCPAAAWPATCTTGDHPVRMITIGEQADGETILMRLPALDLASR